MRESTRPTFRRRKPWQPGAGASAFREDPRRSAGDARVFWRPEIDEFVVTIDALSAPAGGPDAIDLLDVTTLASVLVQENGREELLLGSGRGGVRLSVRSGSCLRGPVRFRYALEGLRTLPAKLQTLKRLLSLVRSGSASRPLARPDVRVGRWIMMLRALDGLRDGASHRELAAALYGEDRTAREWRTGSDYLRLRVQRLVRSGLALSAGGYRALLSASDVGRDTGS